MRSYIHIFRVFFILKSDKELQYCAEQTNYMYCMFIVWEAAVKRITLASVTCFTFS